MSNESKLTPMMQQYFEVKRGLPRDTLLLFRLGDFFEMFFDDAITASRLCGLTLTKRQEHPMAGIPAHAADTYVTKLLAAGKKVAICDQTEAAKPGKLVKRTLTRILSPGTTLAANQLDANRNHYLAAISLDSAGLHAAWLDLSTGEFRLASDARVENLLPVLTALDPAELIIAEGALAEWQAAPHDHAAVHALHNFCTARLCSELPAYNFETATGAKTVMDTLGVLNLQGFGLAFDHPALGPAGALVYYATENLCAKPENLRSLQEYRSANTLLLDPATLRNLEIFASSRGGREGSLLGAINHTVSSAGARLLERWLAAPALDLAEINRRQALVGELLAQPTRLGALRELLASVRDIPRILGRLQNRLRNPRELGGVRDTLGQLPGLRAELAAFGSQLAAEYPARLAELPGLRDLLSRGLAAELPADLADGNYIHAGYDEELDRLRSLTSNNRNWLSELERAEQERTGIRSLKVRFTNNFGYYIEVTKANLHLVPADYIRRQTTVGGERYVTEALKLKEKEIFHAEENALARELELFNALVSSVIADSPALAQTAEALAELDVLAGWAVLAREWDYCRPVLDESDALEITEGRHPVVEQVLKSPAATPARGTTQAFVPNDTALACDDAQLALITGPNMAGKSTYIRQIALIALLAQVGCWVPAKACRIGLVDRIFSRVGASDDLARGNSTFMVEMNETANILNNATDRSLIILDEIGRGTSTYDGLSIAWAVVEHLHRDPIRGPRTLFATHYQELTQLEKHLPRLRNFSVAVKEWNDDIVFVRRVIPGAADRSYGIQVARLAGLPLAVIDRAKTILAQLESDEVSVSLPAPQVRPKKKISVTPADDSQLSLL
ncbi:MAG: DNA mismatch repair protein MutS [Opitutaceae bacterium]|nr:DNA mismatch repair protein MutS [Opitutaceae bacterium]MBP9912943.1 DNA mismatch repair protein MutS [Opitutaceae bacterium]